MAYSVCRWSRQKGKVWSLYDNSTKQDEPDVCIPHPQIIPLRVFRNTIALSRHLETKTVNIFTTVVLLPSYVLPFSYLPHVCASSGSKEAFRENDWWQDYLHCDRVETWMTALTCTAPHKPFSEKQNITFWIYLLDIGDKCPRHYTTHTRCYIIDPVLKAQHIVTICPVERCPFKTIRTQLNRIYHFRFHWSQYQGSNILPGPPNRPSIRPSHIPLTTFFCAKSFTITATNDLWRSSPYSSKSREREIVTFTALLVCIPVFSQVVQWNGKRNRLNRVQSALSSTDTFMSKWL